MNQTFAHDFVQRLEPRMMMDGSQLTPQGTLLINGTDAADQIVVAVISGKIAATVNGQTTPFPTSSVKRIYIDAGAGDDRVANQTTLRSTILGNDGNDSLAGGSSDDSIDGGAGNDTISGGVGSDSITGGGGTDLVDYSDQKTSFGFVIGRTGDESDLNSYPGVMVASADNSTGIDFILDYVEEVKGTNFNDGFKTIGNAAHTYPYPITLMGGGGDDTFDDTGDYTPVVEMGGAGRDTFGSYNHASGVTARLSTLIGGPGNDSFSLVDMPALIDGGPGGDAIINGFSPNLNDFVSVENALEASGTVTGTPGNNYLSLVSSPNATASGARLIGGGGDDTLVGSAGGDDLDGGDGDDVISGGGGADRIYGGNGNDITNGNGGNDRIYGGAGNDTIIGGPGRDHLYGEAGDDYLNTRDNKIDTLYGGDGDDSAKLDHSKVNDIYHDIEKLV